MKIIYEDRFKRYLIVFNELKLKYTGINSRCSPKNKKTISAWNKAVDGLDEKELNSLAKDIVKAIYAACHSEWHRESKFKWITPELFLRADKLDFWVDSYTSDHHINKPKPFKRDRYV